MSIKVGTFNLNNLFSRFNFSGAIDEIHAAGGTGTGVVLSYEFTDPASYRVRVFQGQLIKAKAEADTAAIAARILAMDVDVLAVQEVEDIAILEEFARERLGGRYPHAALVEGNDPRFIDVGVLSKLPLGPLTSYRHYVDPDAGGGTVFSRDLLEVDVLSHDRRKRLFTLYTTHLKSHFGDEEDGGQQKVRNDARRKLQSDSIAKLVAARQRTGARFLVTGDMNDAPDAPTLAALHAIDGRPMTDALANPTESRPAKPEAPGQAPASTAWTHRYKASGQPPRHELLDHIWLSEALAPKLVSATIERRTKHGGDGSDHDPAWVELAL